MTLAEVLRAAADRIDQLAAAAPDGPWRDVQNGWCIRSEPTSNRETWRTVADTPNPMAIGWLTTMNPQVASHLSSWLRGHAEYTAAAQCAPDGHAVAFARVVLGETGEQP